MHLDSWKSPIDLLAGWHPYGLTVSCGGEEEEVWPPSSPNCNFFRYFVWGESEVWVIEKSHNKTRDLIQKMKEVLGSFNRDPW
jgi:hypothetical protein